MEGQSRLRNQLALNKYKGNTPFYPATKFFINSK